MNGITAFVDGSNIYGSDVERSKQLRALTDGLLKINDKKGLQATNLPTRKQCGFSSSVNDLVAGDVRAIVQPTLASMHTLFLSEHNRIAEKLEEEFIKRDVLSSLSKAEVDDLIFEETRKIIGGILQKIVYKDYLPIILGSKALADSGLDFTDSTTYNPQTDPSIFNEFATVAYRFGHSTVSDTFDGVFPWSLKKHFFNSFSQPDFFITGLNGKAWKKEITGAIKQTCPRNDLIVGDALRNNLFTHKEDIVARNLQRGREHGIPSYAELRIHCNLSPLNGNRRPEEITAETWLKLLATYEDNAFDIDAFTGGLAEVAPADGVVGPLFACIIGKQFSNLMSGDRFFFTHNYENQARGLGENTKRSVLGRTLGHIICDNTEAKLTQEDVFKKSTGQSGSNPDENCANINDLDFGGCVQDFIGAGCTVVLLKYSTNYILFR